MTPKRGNKRVAVISAATVGALILAGIAVVESGGAGKGNTSADTSRAGSALSSSQNGGPFPPTSDSSSSSPGGQTPSSSAPSPTPNGAVVPAQPGATTPSQGNSAPITITVPGNNPTGGGSASHPAATTTTSKPVSHPSTHPTTAPPPAAHNPPGPMVAGDIDIQIPGWFGAATVNLS
jgi:hypothetical protein